MVKRGRPSLPLKEKLASRLILNPKTACLVFAGYTDRYGIIWNENVQRPQKAHRVAWELHYGPIPQNMQVLHRCDNPPCCNPDHLFLGTQADNVADMIAKKRGRMPGLFGEATAQAKLSRKQARQIFLGTQTIEATAAAFQVSYKTVANIRRRASWKEATADLISPRAGRVQQNRSP